jgi:spoIIIJ-associated protein
VGDHLTLEEQAETARAFVEGLTVEMGLDAAVTWKTIDEETAEISVQGKELGILVGPGGSTLSALQEVTRAYVQGRAFGQRERIWVDVAGYRAKRVEALQRFTQQIAQEVIESGVERQLEAMGAADRKVVHDTVTDIPGLSTRSDGEEPRRYVVISPVVGADP